MNKSNSKQQRIIGMDMHPDIFSACALEGTRADRAKVQWVHDRIALDTLERWSGKHLRSTDLVVLEASGNSFEVVERLTKLGISAIILESAQAGKLRENYCNDDKSSAIKLARIYLTGMAKIVWQPDSKTRNRRELFYCYERAVKDSTRGKNRIHSFLNEHCIRLPKHTRLTSAQGLQRVLSLKKWDAMEELIINDLFESLWHAQGRRKQMEQCIAMEVYQDKQLRSLMRLMGIRHIIAFTVGAFIGDINRFANAKKLVGYVGLSPRKKQSGNNKEGYKGGIGKTGRKEIRCKLIQAAQNALNHRSSPLHKWGWKLTIKKNRNLATAAVARKIATSIWYLMKGLITPLTEPNKSITTKLTMVSTIIGKHNRQSLGFKKADDFVKHFCQLIITS